MRTSNCFVDSTLAVVMALGSATSSPAKLAGEIDRLLEEAWRAEGLAPAPPVADAKWLRRLSLDLRGTIPSVVEVEEFLASASPDRRDVTIEKFLADRRFAGQFAEFWSNLLLEGAGEDGDRVARRWVAPWIEGQLATGAGFDSIASELVAAEASSSNPGPAGFVLGYRDTIETLSGVVARVFLGLQIQCAQCHDDPAGRFRQDDFNRFTGFFVDLSATTASGAMAGEIQVRDSPVEERLLLQLREAERRAGRAGDRSDEQIRALGRLRRDLREPARGATWRSLLAADDGDFEARTAALPSWAHDVVSAVRVRERMWGVAGHLDGAEDRSPIGATRRRQLADWMVDPANRWFGRAVANRIVAHLLGHGVVEPIDDIDAVGDVVAPEVLDRLAAAFVGSGFDLRLIIGALVRTRAYAAGASTASRRADRVREERCFCAHPIRAIPAEPLERSLAMASGSAIVRSKAHDHDSGSSSGRSGPSASTRPAAIRASARRSTS